MKKYLFTFEWLDWNKSLNDYIIEWCKKHHRSFRYNGFFQLEADVFGTNDYTKFDFEKISGETYGVMIKTKRH